MLEANKKVLEEANAAIARGDFEGFLRHCTDNTEWVFVGDRVLRGKEQVREWMVATYRQPPAFKVERLIGEGSDLAALGEITLVDGTGQVSVHRYCDVWTLREGKLDKLQAFVV